MNGLCGCGAWSYTGAEVAAATGGVDDGEQGATAVIITTCVGRGWCWLVAGEQDTVVVARVIMWVACEDGATTTITEEDSAVRQETENRAVERNRLEGLLG